MPEVAKQNNFYSQGFFGYGEKGDFVYGSVWHILPIVLMIVGIVAIWLLRYKLRAWKGEENFRFAYAFVMLLFEMSYFWRLLYTGNESGDDMLTKLPFQVCQWSLIIACFMMMKKSKRLFSYCFYVCLTCGILPLLMPAVISRTGPTYYRYYQYWGEHIMPIVAVFYMIFVHGFHPKMSHILFPFCGLSVLAIISVALNNAIPGANYMYLAASTEGSSLANLLPANQYIRLAIVTPVFVGLWFGLYGIDRLIVKRVAKRQQKRAEQISLPE